MTGPAGGRPGTVPGLGRRRVIAVDGKTLRGSGHRGEDSRHLLAAFDHAHGVVLGQVEVGAKSNEIPLFTALLDRMEITDAVITADALHAQRDHATYLAGRGAHYLLIIKRNQPGLYAQLATLRLTCAGLINWQTITTRRVGKPGSRPSRSPSLAMMPGPSFIGVEDITSPFLLVRGLFVTSAARTGPTVLARTCERAGFSVNGPIICHGTPVA